MDSGPFRRLSGGGSAPPVPPAYLLLAVPVSWITHSWLGTLIPVSRQLCMDTQHNTTGIAHCAMVYRVLGSGHSVDACMAGGSITHTEHAACWMGADSS